MNQLEDLMKARSGIFKSKVHLLEEYVEKVSQDAGDQNDLEKNRNTRDSFRSAAHGIEGSKSVFAKQIMQIRETDLESLLNSINEYDQVANEKKDLYANFLELNGEPSEALDKMRSELLKHLAGNIVVKEHKIRYQKEQFDRFIASTNMQTLKSNNLTMSEFAHNYAGLIESMIQVSHNGKCPKIEANYDDFGEKTVRPLNATIFYYFFSANRSGKTFAQWMLAAARYPNDKVRRAYMRFFA